MKLNNLVVFCYDFPHFKTKLGLQLLDLFGPENCTIIGAPLENLKISESEIRTQTNETEYLHPREVCDKKNWDYFTFGHNSSENKNLLAELKPSFGLIFGSRILSNDVIEKFNEGILNLHPGLLPENRGLNTIQNAVLKNIPQAVTLHFINNEIDMGRKIFTELIDVKTSDNLFDIQKKITNTEMKIVKNLFEEKIDLNSFYTLETKIPLNKIVGEELKDDFPRLFDNYKNNYSKILNAYKNNE